MRQTKAAGESRVSVSARLGLSKSTVGRWRHTRMNMSNYLSKCCGVI
ncbi:hypothetical protein ACI2JC_05710 [Pseudomonas fulva]